MKEQKDFLMEAIAIATANPNVEIVFCIDSEEICEDSTWTPHRITKVELLPWLESDEHIYVGEDEIKEYFEECFDGMGADEIKEGGYEREIYVSERYDDEVMSMICVFTTSGQAS